MDTEILLRLQEFRNGAGAFLTDFLAKMTYLGELNSVIVIMAVLYWSVSKELGTYLLMGWSGNRLVNGTLKITFCEYRPWIKDPRIQPYGNAVATATGYSFPSGHTTNGTSVFGGWMLRKGSPVLLRVVSGVIVVLIAFSRLYLGVHTPQDVLVGAAAGLMVMWLTGLLMRWIEAHPEKDVLVVCAGAGLCVALALYAALKPYPADYRDGQLIVDGAKMANDTFKAVGYCAAFLCGWILERRFVGFTTDVPLRLRLSRAVVGLLGYYAVSTILAPFIKTCIPGFAGTTLSCFAQVFYVVFLVPLCAKLAERKTAAKQNAVSR